MEKVAYDELVQYPHRAAEESVGNQHGTQTQDQRHRTFSKIILKGKLREAIRFIREWEIGRGVLPDKWATEKLGVTDKTVAGGFTVKHPPEKENLVMTLET